MHGKTTVYFVMVLKSHSVVSKHFPDVTKLEFIKRQTCRFVFFPLRAESHVEAIFKRLLTACRILASQSEEI